MKAIGPAATALVVTVLILAGCGGDDGDSGSASSAQTTTDQTTTTEAQGGGQTVDVSADPGGALEFTQSSLEAKAGSVTFNFDNPAQTPHDFCIEAEGDGDLGCSDTVTGGSSTLTVDLKPGQYMFYCSVDAHKDAGMEGTLTVK